MSTPNQFEHKHTNRLAQETSPYLLQHAHNPVDWYAWGPEAFAAAREQNKPIFLSVGYSTCYWCHVMERQCFENEAIAAEMNHRCINIKVDREERPDVDQLYMTAVQVLTRRGGWPMSVFLTPDLKPFYGGTYFPPEDSHGRPGFLTLLRAIEDAYLNRADEVSKTATQLESILQQLSRPALLDHAITIDAKFIDDLIDRSTADYEPVHGGFGSAPKFPRQTLLELLLTHHAHHPDERRAKMIQHTLDAMANGGIRDHLGGGFHRYSTDDRWLVPHFEIMLYDNAMLGWCYVEAFRQFKNPRYARIARGIFDFILRQMTSPRGGFYTAFDAEVDAQEGLTYLWTREEIEQVLGADDAARFNRIYGVSRGPNFVDPHPLSSSSAEGGSASLGADGEDAPDKNILYLPDGPVGEDDPAMIAIREKLLAVRLRRKQPSLDTKILTSWNALMIRALAYGGEILNEKRYLDAAISAARFILTHHRSDNGGLFRTSRPDADGSATAIVPKYRGFLDDYAFMAQALLSLHRATGDEAWKDEGASIASAMRRKFGDETQGGYFFTDSAGSDLIVRQKTAADSPLPAGNAIAAIALLELGHSSDAAKVLATFAAQIEQHAEGMSAMVQAADVYVQAQGELKCESTGPASADRVLSLQEVAANVVTLAAAWVDATTLHVHVRVLGGYHINAHQTPAKLVATRLDVLDRPDATVEYPPGEDRRYAYAEAPIRVLDSVFTIIVRFAAPPTGDDPLHLRLIYQPCDDNSCLPAVAKQFQVQMH